MLADSHHASIDFGDLGEVDRLACGTCTSHYEVPQDTILGSSEAFHTDMSQYFDRRIVPR